MESVTYSRKELYELVWTESLLSISKRYKISDVGLRKICIKMNIPLPGQGHWQKIRAGVRIYPKRLPTNFTGPEEVSFQLRAEDEEKRITLNQLEKEIRDDPKLPTTVQKRLATKEKLILDAKRDLERDHPSGYRYVGSVSTRYGQLDITVSKGSISRALRIMDAIIRLLKIRGHSVLLKNGKSYVLIEEEEIEISMRERFKKIPKENPRDTTNYSPSGILVFRIGWLYKKEIKDGRKPLEEQVARIVAQLELEGSREKEKTTLREEWHRKREAERQMEKERQRQVDEEVAAFNDLYAQAKRFEKASYMRDYISAYEKDALKKGILTDEKINWITWARKRVDWYDPMSERNHENLIYIGEPSEY